MVFLKLLFVFYLGCWLETNSAVASKMTQALTKRNIGFGENPWNFVVCVQRYFKDPRQCLNSTMLNIQKISKHKIQNKETNTRWNQNRKENHSKKFTLSKLRIN
jgi:hypothetical protein